ncbi:MAG TPA: polysaccharide biosynthesis tyrosine autokinase, partial [Acidimicrobiales bacterium]
MPVNAFEYLRLIRKRWYLVAGCVAAMAVLGITFTATAHREYRADAQVFAAATVSEADVGQLALANTYIQARVQSYPSLATSPMVTKPVIRNLGLKVTPDQLASHIHVVAPVGTVLMTVSVLDGDRHQAARIANAVADELIPVVEHVERTEASKVSPVRLTIAQRATVPTAPVSPNPTLDIGLALVVGLGLGIGAALLRGVLDTRVHEVTQLAAVTGAPVLAALPWDPTTATNPLAVVSGASGATAEAFRQLRTNLQFVDIDHPPKIVAITSAGAHEGKTTTALNLAAALAEAGQRVCLVEADLRRPKLASILGVPGEVGLSSLLVDKAHLEDALQEVGPRLTVLPAGTVPPNAGDLLASTIAPTVFRGIAAGFDCVVVDTAPLLAVSDGAAVASRADATLLV